MSDETVDHLSLLADAVAAVTIETDDRFTWFGSRWPPLGASSPTGLPASVRRDLLRSLLRDRLYEDFYKPGAARPTSVGESVDHPPDENFVDSLSTANQGSGYWDPGWVWRTMDDDVFEVEKDALKLRVARSQWRLTAPTKRGTDFEKLSQIHFPKEFRRLSPGYYMALSDVGLVERQPILRIYWNVPLRHAEDLMYLVTETFNRRHLRFTFKVSSDAQNYDRSDSAVLYLDGTELDQGLRTVSDIHAAARAGDWLRNPTPALTKRLAPGIGLAESPEDGESFGISRCGLIADGLLAANHAQLDSLNDRLNCVAQTWRDAGLRLDRPHLNPGSTNDYILPFARSTHDNSSEGVRAAFIGLLNGAQTIGLELARLALWDGDRCSWLGSRIADASDPRRQAETASVGPDLYSGTAGIALFLGELHNQTGNNRIGRLCRGAATHAASTWHKLVDSDPYGLYTGGLGIAVALTRLGRRAAMADLRHTAQEILTECLRRPHDEMDPDLLSGRAGAILALLYLARALARPDALAEASRLGDALVSNASRDSDGACSWRSYTALKSTNLTGFSHGAAGISYGLLKLFSATGRPELLETALGARLYEKRYFSREAGNWADLRARPEDETTAPMLYSTAWCHGAPGIALSRIELARQQFDPEIREEAEIALETTRCMVERDVANHSDNYSLCHGVAGNADALLSADDFGTDGHREVARRAAELGLQRFGRQNAWSSGLGPGLEPGLMLGLAGTGYFFLRARCPDTPSVLAL